MLQRLRRVCVPLNSCYGHAIDIECKKSVGFQLTLLLVCSIPLNLGIIMYVHVCKLRAGLNVASYVHVVKRKSGMLLCQAS